MRNSPAFAAAREPLIGGSGSVSGGMSDVPGSDVAGRGESLLGRGGEYGDQRSDQHQQQQVSCLVSYLRVLLSFIISLL